MSNNDKDGAAVDQTMPDGKWVFDDSVAQVFDDMLSRSIPQYDVMRDAVSSVGYPFVKPNTDIIDLGCSRGLALEPFVKKFGANNHFVGIEVSQPMLAASRELFAGYIKAGVVEIKDADLRAQYPFVQASLTLSVFTLQFVPIEHRQRLVQDIYDHTVTGGALVLVEKILGETSKIDKVLVGNYYALKASNGYSQEAIERKRLSLEGVLVPVTAAWNVELMRQAGFRQIDCFWRWMNFSGWLAIK